jgi:hypothetical protein
MCQIHHMKNDTRSLCLRVLSSMCIQQHALVHALKSLFCVCMREEIHTASRKLHAQDLLLRAWPRIYTYPCTYTCVIRESHVHIRKRVCSYMFKQAYIYELSWAGVYQSTDFLTHAICKHTPISKS